MWRDRSSSSVRPTDGDEAGADARQGGVWPSRIEVGRTRQPLRCAQFTSSTTSATVRGAQVPLLVDADVAAVGGATLGAASVRGNARGLESVDNSTLRSVRAR
jgi:hypothetical protein